MAAKKCKANKTLSVLELKSVWNGSPGNKAIVYCNELANLMTEINVFLRKSPIAIATASASVCVEGVRVQVAEYKVRR